jgi:anaerobic selenocysteine-containing dehydrogenase
VYGGRRVIFMHAVDIRAQGFAPGDWVDLTSHFDGRQRHVERFMIVEYKLPRGCAATYFPETNPLVPLGNVAQGSNQPASKSIVITLARSAAEPGKAAAP